MNMDMENMFATVQKDLLREMAEGEYLAVESTNDEGPSLAFRKGAFAVVEISGDVLKNEPGARLVRLQGSADPLVHPDLLRSGAGWSLLLDTLDKKVPREYLCALLCYLRCAADRSLDEKAVSQILDDWNKDRQGLTHATATLHYGGGEKSTSQNQHDREVNTRHVPDRVFVAVYPSHVPEGDRFRDFKKIAQQKCRDAVMANASPAQQYMIRMFGADKV
jgi:hypothetical protein